METAFVNICADKLHWNARCVFKRHKKTIYKYIYTPEIVQSQLILKISTQERIFTDNNVSSYWYYIIADNLKSGPTLPVSVHIFLICNK